MIATRVTIETSRRAMWEADRLFVHSLEETDLPSDRCQERRSLMVIETIETTRHKETSPANT